MHEEDDWKHNVECDALESAVGYVTGNDVLQVSQKKCIFRCFLEL